MNQISDINTYTSRMSKSCDDKLFFMNKISDVKNIVDFWLRRWNIDQRNE